MSTAAQREAAGHDVIFADSDAELVAVAGDRLARAHAAGSTLIVIATPDHRSAFADGLAARSVDPGAARADGSLVELDAATVLGRIVDAGALDAGAFDRVVGTLVREAAGRGPVHAFGEMVGLLWEDGRVGEALELETAWNALLDETGADLLCGYDSTVVDDHTAADDVRAVCRLHSAVVAGDRFERTWDFEAGEALAGAARRVVTSALRARGLSGPELSDAEIILGELAANAARHARTPFSVSLAMEDGRIVVAVRDDSDELPVVAEPRTDQDASGRGLHLVAALARSWGIEPRDSGKLVWAELKR
ncbi:Anti-sigma regulatory factor (Ser/Thr protein kinase) [Nocardioides terrae]|uniref:Anti-sigma regulatory factor (Ser/Thr protein kinase) n=1 Tax=Nocardioides terrae TaxID=574651 RepID=A0A1I1I658_9ACTN|nr:ATP-binding protein [Nocardioides terrae]SFC28710.1 Anti-sigma regulatory factor (Ser/Thr protein kinase) [Nocardioides terrae]